MDQAEIMDTFRTYQVAYAAKDAYVGYEVYRHIVLMR